jgi:site-specific DNA recombinase
MTKLFAAYLRTSTEDDQAPEDSRRWQLALAEQLIASVGGQIVAVYHDIDVSRSVPWSLRAEASRLLDDAADKSRAWEALVIGEPQRAFLARSFNSSSPCSATTASSCGCPKSAGRSTRTAKPTTW